MIIDPRRVLPELVWPGKRTGRFLVVASLAVLTAWTNIRGDEGMWTFDNLPIRQLKERYGFEPTPEWIAKVRSGAVRFNSGGSGSFVSRRRPGR